MRTFYCAKCIQQGRFVTIDQPLEKVVKSKTSGQFSEKTADLNQIVDEKIVVEQILQAKLRTLTRKTELLKTLYNDQKLKLEETKKLLTKTRDEVEAERRQHKHNEGKIDLIKRFIAKRKISVKKRRDEEMCLLDELKQHVSRRVYQLSQEVFPIEQVNLLDQNNSFVNMETSPLLTFSDGSHHQIEQSTAYSIVEPWLPSNGDYSAYSLWVNDNKDQAQVSETSERGNPAFQIGAALAYTTQLVKNIASFLDVILPIRMELDMFSGELLNDAMFSYYVAKLNSNVIHLCISQGVDVSLLNSQRTLKNLLLLFDLNLSDLGRRPIIDLDNEEIVGRIEGQLSKDLSLVSEDFYDASKFANSDPLSGFPSAAGPNENDEDVSDSEWEISDTINPMELNQMAAEQQQLSNQQNSYMARPLRLLSSFWTASGN